MMRWDTRIDLDVRRFFHWWGSELQFLVPRRLRKLLGRARPVLLVTRVADGLEAVFWDEEERRDLGLFTLDETGVQKRQTLQRELPRFADADLVLHLTPSDSLLKRFKLPAATEENLLQVAGFELDRLTPFKAEQVYYDARMLERLPESKQILVELALAPRSKLDPLLEELMVWGWQPARVDISGDPARQVFQLLPERLRLRKEGLAAWLNSALAALAAIMLLLAAVVPIWHNYRLAGELDQEVRKASKLASEVDALKQAAEKLDHEARILQEKKQSEPALVDVLNELSQVIPDGTWLYGLQYKDQRLVIQGQSLSASSLIAVIEESPYFRNTAFVSPVTKDAASGLERFQIASDVINARFANQDTESLPNKSRPTEAPDDAEFEFE